MGLNPRFDGAFLIPMMVILMATLMGLNPRFDGAFLIRTSSRPSATFGCLNPRFDGAFLNFVAEVKPIIDKVLIPDLMGLF